MRLRLIVLALCAVVSGCGPSNKFVEEEIAVLLGPDEESADYLAHYIAQSKVVVLARVVEVDSMVSQMNDDDSLGQEWAASRVFVEKIFKGSVSDERLSVLAPFTSYYPDYLPPNQARGTTGPDRQPPTLMMHDGARAILFLNQNKVLTNYCVTPVYNGQAVFRLKEEANKPGGDNPDLRARILDRP